MFNNGKCPNSQCARVLQHVDLEKISVRLNLLPKWIGVSYVCPSCRTILGVQIDPIAIKNDIVSEVEETVKSHR